MEMLVSGEGRSVSNELIKETLDNLPPEILANCLNLLESNFSNSMKELNDLLDKELVPYEESVLDLKRRIKYSKNPMELKMLNKQLNELYKTKKRRKT